MRRSTCVGRGRAEGITVGDPVLLPASSHGEARESKPWTCPSPPAASIFAWSRSWRTAESAGVRGVGSRESCR